MVDSKIAIVNSAYVLTALSYTIILTRLALRRLKHESFKIDDYLMALGMVLYAMFTASYPVALYNGINVAIHPINVSVIHPINVTSIHPEKLSPTDVQRVTLGSQWLLAGRPFLLSYLWTLKTCLLVFYGRLTEGSKELLAIKATGGMLGATWLGCMLTIFCECRPIYLAWQVLPSAPECAKAIATAVVLGLADILTDFLIMAIPLRIVFRLRLDLRTKIELAVVFLMGTFVIVLSIVKLAVSLTTWTVQNKLVFGQLECFFATIVANAPILHGIWRHGFNHVRRLHFGQDSCTPEVVVRRPTGSAGSTHELTPQPPERTRTMRERARASVRRFRDRIRHSLGRIEIEKSVELMQETKLKREGRDSEAGDPDAFQGAAHVAHIVTHISTDPNMANSAREKNNRSSRFSRFKRVKESEGTSGGNGWGTQG